MKKQKKLEKEFLSEVKKAFTVVNDWKVSEVVFWYKSTTIVLRLKGHTDITFGFSYDERKKNCKFRTAVEESDNFDPCESSEFEDYYRAVSNLLSQKDLLADLKKIMKKYTEMYEPEDDED